MCPTPRYPSCACPTRPSNSRKPRPASDVRRPSWASTTRKSWRRLATAPSRLPNSGRRGCWGHSESLNRVYRTLTHEFRRLTMKFGIFLLLQSPDMRPSQETYDHALEQGVLADQLGFDYIVAAEHHFSSYGFLPSPLLLIPVLAERTKQIRFSTAVVVLPLRNPIQLAEEIAMLDLVTRGRVEVGFGTGYPQSEFQRFGVNLAENRAMFEESLELITKLLSTENVSHQGRYWTLPETTTLPRQ